MNSSQYTKPIDNELGRANEMRRTRIFISYKYEATPDQSLAEDIFDQLKQHYEVFMDRKSVKIGEHWGKRIEEELSRADYIVVLLSTSSVQSDMVVGEMEKAYYLTKMHGAAGRPIIIPINVAYAEPLPYPLSVYLNHLQRASWKSTADTPKLINDLKRAISWGSQISDTRPLEDESGIKNSGLVPPPLPSVQIEMPEGTMDLQSKFYVIRPCDLTVQNAIRQRGVTITIKGPRQVGKSSLLIRMKREAIANNKRTVFLDFQLFDRATLNNAELFFRQFCELITYELKIKSRVNEYWSLPLSNKMRCTQYVEDYLLEELNELLLLAMDEVDTIFNADFDSDFFSMLRAWHNSRADVPICFRDLHGAISDY
jgi:hypothetical protein